MSKIQTRSGIWFDLEHPRPEDVHIEDIAAALSKLCRYGGHSSRFYSVGEHCLLIARALLHDGYDKRVALAGLLHDASEAYVCDVPRPLKQLLSEYKAIEERVQRVIAARYGIDFPFPEVVHEYDERIIADEYMELMQCNREAAERILRGRQPLGVEVRGRSPERTEHVYLSLLSELSDGREEY